MSELLLEEKGGIQVNNEKELYSSVKMLLEDPDLCSCDRKIRENSLRINTEAL